MLFPEVVARNLEGRSFRLPRDLDGRLNILVLAFHREQQEDVDAWLSAAEPLLREYPEVRAWELPVLRRGTFLFRLWLDSAMKMAIRDRAVRERVITVHVDKDELRRDLDIPGEELVTAMLVDRAGRILWRTSGRPGMDALRQLGQTLQRELAPPPPLHPEPAPAPPG